MILKKMKDQMIVKATEVTKLSFDLSENSEISKKFK